MVASIETVDVLTLLTWRQPSFTNFLEGVCVRDSKCMMVDAIG